MKAEPIFLVVDLFCGAGGTTTGFAMAEGYAQVIACVNHDPKAIKSHWRNHPEVAHFEEDIRTLELSALVELVQQAKNRFPDAMLILWASLECTNFSKAKGGQPRDADSRTLADHLDRYIVALQPDYIQIENVVEFMSWGPLDEKGKPVSRKNGQDWMRWRNLLCSHGYRDEWREMNSANYGAYTSRNRLFGIFAKDGLPVAWPNPTHAKNPSKFSMHGDLERWKAVKEVLNFSDEGESIFSRKKALSDKTLERIYAGLIKYVAKGDKAFISKYYSGRPAGKVNSLDQPASTVTTFGNQNLVQTVGFTGKSVNEPAGTITCIDHHALVQVRKDHHPDCCCEFNPSSEELQNTVLASECCPVHNYNPVECLCETPCGKQQKQGEFLTHYYSSGGGTSSIDQPAPTIPTKARTAIVSPEFLTIYNGKSLHRSVDEPSPVIPTNDRLSLVQPQYLVNYNHSSKVNDVNDPSPTITTKDKIAVVQPQYFIDKHYGAAQNQSIDQPAGTILPCDKHRLVEATPFIMPTNYGNGPKSIEEPLQTITANRKHHYLLNPCWKHQVHSTEQPAPVLIAKQDKTPLYLVQVESGRVAIAVYEDDSEIMIKIKEFMVIYELVDIKMRMLLVGELLKIQGFPDGYKLEGNQADQKKFIGNSVVPHVVKAWTIALAQRIIEDTKTKVA
jgi:DNA (cytosine-5)-methyltransferase 1